MHGVNVTKKQGINKYKNDIKKRRSCEGKWMNKLDLFFIFVFVCNCITCGVWNKLGDSGFCLIRTDEAGVDIIESFWLSRLGHFFSFLLFWFMSMNANYKHWVMNLSFLWLESTLCTCVKFPRRRYKMNQTKSRREKSPNYEMTRKNMVFIPSIP